MYSVHNAGAVLFTGAVLFITGVHLAEFIYPGYSVSGNYISDLGVRQPSAPVFNASVALLGISILLGSYFLWQEFHSTLISVFLGLAGAGAIGVGVFPGTAGVIHVIVSLMAFLFGGLSAIASCRLVKAPFNYFSVLSGMTSLTALILFASDIYLGLGPGGMERMIVYPVLVWVAGLGGYLMAAAGS